MHTYFHKIFTTISLLLIASWSLLAQTTGGDFMRSIGKIYVVVAVVVAGFIGLVIFLIILDRRLSKLEKQIGNNHE